MDVTTVAEELYALRPDDFVARRTALAAEARQTGDKSLATTVKGLAKPTTAAWVVNMLVRHDPDQVEQVLALGSALREAQETMAGDDLRALGRQRRQLTGAVTRRARSLAAELGQKVADPVAAQVEETLHAAMVDEDAAAAVRTGLLVRPLAVTGLEPVDVTGSVAFPEALGEHVVRRTPAQPARREAQQENQQREAPEATRPELSVVPDNSRAIAEAEADLEQAEASLTEAERRLAKAVRKVGKRESKGLQLRAELEELRRRVAEVEERIEGHEEVLADAEETRDERESAVQEARAARDAARRTLDDLR